MTHRVDPLLGKVLDQELISYLENAAVVAAEGDRNVQRPQQLRLARSIIGHVGGRAVNDPGPVIGEQQRLAIARALAARPGLVIADEPFSSLDPGNTAIVLDLFRELKNAGVTFLFSATSPGPEQDFVDIPLRPFGQEM